jgi:CHAT domain-containing protein/tetratricopeptide (TPR) repeat protein
MKAAHASIRATANPDALQTRALIDLLWSDPSGKRIQPAISSLQAASKLAGNSGPVLANLSGAYLIWSEQTQNPFDLVEALEIADEALELEPRSRTAQFNLALTLERWGFDDQAVAAWQAYLELDPHSGWAAEARTRIKRMSRTHTSPVPQPDAPASVMIRYAIQGQPQDAQLLGWDHLLGEWGDAVMKGSDERAADRLEVADSMGESLVRQRGDETLTDEVRTIRDHSADPRATRRLAHAHRLYNRARHAYRIAEYEIADTLFARVLHVADGGTPLRLWAEVFHAATQGYQSPDRGEELVRKAISRMDTLRYPGLVGRAHWVLGTSLLRQDRHQDAADEYQVAARFFSRAGEPEHLGAVTCLYGVAKHRSGDERAAYVSLHASLAHLRRYRASPWLHTALYQLAEVVSGNGRVRVAARILAEDAGVAERTRIPVYVAENHITRTRLLAPAGRVERTARDLDAGWETVRQMKDGLARRWLTIDLWEAEAANLAKVDPRRATELLDSAVAGWTAAGVPVRVLPPLLARADTHLAMGHDSTAESDLRHALRLLEQQRLDLVAAPDRARLLDARAGVFNRLAMLRVRAGRPREALGYLERGRASYTRAGDETRSAGPPRGTALSYALIGDTLLIWTVRGPAVTLSRRTVNRREFQRQVDRARTILELRSDEAAVRPVLETLYSLLVAPVEDRLGQPGSPLVVVADGEIAGVPFAALWSQRRRRYLVEDHAIRFSATLRDVWMPPPVRHRALGRVLIVADPAFDRTAYPELQGLPGAREEAQAIMRLDPRAVLLQQAEADRPRLLAGLAGAEVVHYAGHALFDDDQPGRSELVLAPPAGTRGSGGLAADEIARLRLPHLRLVVLSACETLRSRSGRSGGFTGLAGAFLEAGARGVVGGLWRVDDHATPVLIQSFYREYQGGVDGAEALAQAQREMLQSPNRAFRSPSAWAAFRYAGD